MTSSKLNLSVLRSLLTLFYSPFPPSAALVPKPKLYQWFSATPHIDEGCVSFRPFLDSISPTARPLPPPPTSHAAELEQTATIVGDLTQVLEGCKTDEELSSDATALVMMLDQVPRNLFRDRQGIIYAHYDRVARAVTRTLLEKKLYKLGDGFANPVRRMFWLLPLSHSEWIEDHELHVKLTADLKEEVKGKEWGEDKDGIYELMGVVEKVELQHADIIRRFGRYPHRNNWAGREMTTEEQEYLDNGGATFGTDAKKRKEE